MQIRKIQTFLFAFKPSVLFKFVEIGGHFYSVLWHGVSILDIDVSWQKIIIHNLFKHFSSLREKWRRYWQPPASVIGVSGIYFNRFPDLSLLLNFIRGAFMFFFTFQSSHARGGFPLGPEASFSCSRLTRLKCKKYVTGTTGVLGKKLSGRTSACL